MQRTLLKLKRNIRSVLSRTDAGYRFYLKKDYGVGKPVGNPQVSWANSALKTRREWSDACEQARLLALPSHPTPPKNWDGLVALDSILRNCGRQARILDAGALLNSMILPWLYLYGYENLLGINTDFPGPVNRGKIRYDYGDITHTKLREESFQAITCLSVVEHGVDMQAYFREMSRLLEPGGILITSTDYYETPIDTKGQSAFGAPIKIFSKQELENAITLAEEFSLYPTGPVDFQCREKAVSWHEYGLEYTFINFVLRKEARPRSL